MRIEIINTGSELLLGHVTNTHLGFLARELFSLGLRVGRQVCVPDGEAIKTALAEAFPRADLVIVTGGLGPTSDDITRELVAELLDRPLREDATVWAHIGECFARRGLQMTPNNRRQAQVPEGAEVLPNPHGTAPGLYFPPGPARSTPALFLLPGPPRELHPMVSDEVLPRLRTLPGVGHTRECRVYRMAGIGESMVESLIGEKLESVPGLELGYCARAGEVDLRLIATPEILAQVEPDIFGHLGAHIFSRDGSTLETAMVRLLRERHQTLAVAESCTGGFLAHRLTNVPGASEVFLAGFVTYSNASKTSVLGVPSALISQHGAVSGPVACAMAEGALRATGADHALATTGIAGPGGGSVEKPVGTVFIALASGGRPTIAELHRFSRDREYIKSLSAQAALDLLRRRPAGTR